MPKIPSAVNRTLDILLLFNSSITEMSIDKISQSVDLPRSTTYRYVSILCEKGFLEKRRTGLFQPGPNLLLLGQVANQQNEMARIAMPYLREVADEVGETVLLTRIAGTRSVCVERVEARHNMRITFEIGQSQPLHAGASSKVLLAYLEQGQRDQYLSGSLEGFTEYTPVNPKALKHDLEEIQANGYCITDSEVDIGAIAIAVPILNRKKRIFCALSTAGPSFRMDSEVIDNHLRILQLQAKKIQDALIKQGY